MGDFADVTLSSVGSIPFMFSSNDCAHDNPTWEVKGLMTPESLFAREARSQED